MMEKIDGDVADLEGGHEGGGGRGAEGFRRVHERVGGEPCGEREGRGAQDDEEDQPGGGVDREEGGLGGHAEGARRGSCVLRQAQAVLRGRWRELRGPRGAPQGGDRVSPGGAPHLERGGHRVPAEVSSGCLTSFRVTLHLEFGEYFLPAD